MQRTHTTFIPISLAETVLITREVLQVSCSIQLIPMPVHGTMVSHTRIHLADNTSDLQASKSEQNRVWYMTLSATNTRIQLNNQQAVCCMNANQVPLWKAFRTFSVNLLRTMQTMQLPATQRLPEAATGNMETGIFPIRKNQSVLRFIKENIGRKPLNSRTRETIAATFTITAR